MNRSTSQFDNLSDCSNKLWDKSDPIVAKGRERLLCRHCIVVGHTIHSWNDIKAELSGFNSEFESLLSFFTDFS